MRRNFFFAVCAFIAFSVHAQPWPLGPFTDRQDVGQVLHPGAAERDSQQSIYRVTGSGYNMWSTNDAFQFVWKKMSGDLRFSATVRFPKPGGNAHRKACLMIRQSLEAGSPYVDIAAHGNGLTALQCRDHTNGLTTEVIVSDDGPQNIEITKRGRFATVAFSKGSSKPKDAGGELPITFQEPFYVGLAVCAHDSNAVETAEFSNVELEPLPPVEGEPSPGANSLETIPLSGDRRVLWTTADNLSNASFNPDGKRITVKSGKKMVLFTLPSAIAVGAATNAPQGRGRQSPDGKWVAVLSAANGGNVSEKATELILEIRPATDGPVRASTRLFGDIKSLSDRPWSPDSKQVTFVSYQPVYK